MKDRKIFSINEFRGLDTESKQLKVSPARATLGENFVIDSGTLKTRKGFVTTREIILSEGEKILGSHEYNGAVVYVTNQNFYVIDETGTYSTTSIDMYDETNLISKLYTTNTFEVDGEDIVIANDSFYTVTEGEPMFKEEKKCLFIFCIGVILIFSVLSGVYTLYELSNKPSNPFDEVTQEENYSAYENLPTPYAPTLFIGDTSFEDVNLLSNKSKYRLFAQVPEQAVGGYVSYTLPTHYNVDKHTGFTSNVEFYKGKFDDVKTYPTFLGVKGENNFSIVGWASKIDISEVEETIIDTYKVDKEFVYVGSSYISKVYDITKEKFFALRTDSGKTVFEYLMYLASILQVDTLGYITLSLPVEFTKVTKDANGIITEVVKVNDTVDIYVGYKVLTQYVGERVTNGDYEDTVFLTNDADNDPTDLLEYMPFPEALLTEPLTWLTWSGGSANSKAIFTNAFYIPDNNLDVLKGIVETYLRNNGLEEGVEYIGILGYSESRDKFNVLQGWYLYTIVYKIETVAESDLLYNIEHTEDGFIFKVRDIFYDYQGEPAIDIEITFTDNPDYDLIAKSTFGIEFANRLFLAGNSDYPNIDRYNISNDLLGEGVDNQSYELSYFPSKNFNVLGGKSAINGYAIATDNTMYVTKVYKNTDFGMFVRIYDLEKASFFDQRTNIKISPINNKCIVRYANDIIMLTTEGLYAVELTQNVLTDERLVKVRSELINEALKEEINENPFMIEDNRYLYIVLGEIIYFVDNKYGYEFVKWTFDNNFTKGMFENGVPYFLDNDNRYYTLEETGEDRIKKTYKNSMIMGNYNLGGASAYWYKVPDDVFNEMKNADKIYIDNGFTKIATGTLNQVETNQYYFDTLNPILYDGSLLTGRCPLVITDHKPFARIDEYCYIQTFKYANMSSSSWFLDPMFLNFEMIIEQPFTTTNVFVEGAGIECAEHTKIKVVYDSGSESYKYEILSDTSLFSKVKLDEVYGFPIPGFNYRGPYSIYLKSEDVSFKIENAIQDSDGTDSYFQLFCDYFELEATDITSAELTDDLLIADNYRKIYNVTDEFVVTDKFTQAEGYIASANSKIYIVKVGAIYKFSFYRPNEFYLDYQTDFYASIGLGKMFDFTAEWVTPITFSWQSAILDFGDYLSEKTIFKTIINATRQDNGSTLYISRRTMRNSDNLNTLTLSKPFTDTLSFEVFGSGNFGEAGMALPFKENNFLYIQISLRGSGIVNVNSISFLYKNNRMVKSIG